MKNSYSEILAEIIKVAYLESEPDQLIVLINGFENSEKLRHLIIFHGLRPAASVAFQNAGFSTDSFPLMAECQKYIKRQAMLNLQFVRDYQDTSSNLTSKGVRILPYKGLLFTDILYGNSVLRESSDVDVLVHPDDISQAIKYFFLEDYSYNFFDNDIKTESPEKLIELILGAKGKTVLFEKGNFRVDLHWGLNYGFLPYKVNYKGFFEGVINSPKLGAISKLESIFWMIILHHGGKELWVKQRHLLDLMAFLKEFSNVIDWSKQIELSKEYKLYKLMIVGVYLVEKLYGFEIPSRLRAEFKSINPRQIQGILNYQDYARPWKTLFARLRYEKVLVANQDEGFSLKKYIFDIFDEYSMPNPLENSRIISFPENYRFLNFCSKLITYAIGKMF